MRSVIYLQKCKKANVIRTKIKKEDHNHEPMAKTHKRKLDEERPKYGWNSLQKMKPMVNLKTRLNLRQKLKKLQTSCAKSAVKIKEV